MVHQCTSIYVIWYKWFINLRQITSSYVKFDIVACPQIQGCVFLRKKSPCGRHIDHGVVGGTQQITKNQQNPQDTCSKIPGAYFFSEKQSPCGKHIDHGVVGGVLKWKKIHISSQDVLPFWKMLTFQNVKIEILKCVWEQFPCVQKPKYTENH